MATVAPSRTAPTRTHAQRLAALEQANHIRSARARMKTELKARHIYATELLHDPPAWLHAMRALDLLLAIPNIGTVRAHNILRAAGCSHTKTVGGLTDRQRGVLIAKLEHKETTNA